MTLAHNSPRMPFVKGKEDFFNETLIFNIKISEFKKIHYYRNGKIKLRSFLFSQFQVRSPKPIKIAVSLHSKESYPSCSSKTYENIT